VANALLDGSVQTPAQPPQPPDKVLPVCWNCCPGGQRLL